MVLIGLLKFILKKIVGVGYYALGSCGLICVAGMLCGWGQHSVTSTMTIQVCSFHNLTGIQ